MIDTEQRTILFWLSKKEKERSLERLNLLFDGRGGHAGDGVNQLLQRRHFPTVNKVELFNKKIKVLEACVEVGFFS